MWMSFPSFYLKEVFESAEVNSEMADIGTKMSADLPGATFHDICPAVF